MNELRPWHIALVIGAALVLGVSAWWQFGRDDGIDIADSVIVADIRTGELWETPKPRNRTIVYPIKNPDTKTDSLMPVLQESGKWSVVFNYRKMANSLLGDKPEGAAMDPKTHEVRVKTPAPVKRDLF